MILQRTNIILISRSGNRWVKEDDRINGGAVLGTSGNTGEFAFEKYHLHFSIFPSNAAPKLGTSGKWVSMRSVNPLNHLPK
jgi:murein DD-endopeptidase MepM/ murein hydrolase activator NlpD